MNYVIPEEDDYLSLISDMKRQKRVVKDIPIASLESTAGGDIVLDGPYETILDAWHDNHLRFTKRAGKYAVVITVWKWDMIDTDTGGKVCRVLDGKISASIAESERQEADFEVNTAILILFASFTVGILTGLVYALSSRFANQLVTYSSLSGFIVSCLCFLIGLIWLVKAKVSMNNRYLADEC